MDDLISRQTAIDKFESWLKVEGYSEGELNMLKAILCELRELPTAKAEVIRCYECKYASYEPCGHVKNVYVCNRTRWTRMNGGNLSVCFCSYAEREGEDVHD